MSNLSPAPGAPQTPAKAMSSAVVAACVTALTAYFTGGNSINVAGVVATVVAALVGFVTTYSVKNKAA